MIEDTTDEKPAEEKKHHKKDHHKKHHEEEVIVEPVVEPVKCVLDEVQQPLDKSPFDMDLHYHTDYTRSVVATIGSDTTPFHLLPDTAMS